MVGGVSVEDEAGALALPIPMDCIAFFAAVFLATFQRRQGALFSGKDGKVAAS